MSLYKADLHVHTDASGDGRSTLEALAAAAKAAGLDAIAVTDHGCCTPVPESLAGVLLIPGCEIATAAGHMTALFLDRPVDLAALGRQPEPAAAIAAVHGAGGLAVLAHPYEHRDPDGRWFVSVPDGVEAANARADMKDARANEKAAVLAEKLGCVSVGGSDGHHTGEVGNAYTEIEAAALSVQALRAAVRDGACRAVLRRRTGWMQKGLSQWRAARRHGGVRRLAHGLVYLARCAGWAALERLRRRA